MVKTAMSRRQFLPAGAKSHACTRSLDRWIPRCEPGVSDRTLTPSPSPPPSRQSSSPTADRPSTSTSTSTRACLTESRGLAPAPARELDLLAARLTADERQPCALSLATVRRVEEQHRAPFFEISASRGRQTISDHRAVRDPLRSLRFSNHFPRRPNKWNINIVIFCVGRLRRMGPKKMILDREIRFGMFYGAIRDVVGRGEGTVQFPQRTDAL